MVSFRFYKFSILSTISTYSTILPRGVNSRHGVHNAQQNHLSNNQKSEGCKRERKRHYKRTRPPLRNDNSGSALGIVIRVIFMILILMFFLLPQFQPYRDTFLDYLMAGLYKYQEVPDSVDFTVERIMTIDSDDYLNYTLYVNVSGCFSEVQVSDILPEGLVFDCQWVEEGHPKPNFEQNGRYLYWNISYCDVCNINYVIKYKAFYYNCFDS